MISLDLTLLFQIIGFFILLVILNRFLYKPVQAMLKEREGRIDGSLRKTAGTEKEVAEGLAAYGKKLKEAAVKGHEERGRMRQEALVREKGLLEAARAEAASELSSIRKELEANKSSALAGLKADARGLARDIAGKVLERNVAGLLVLGVLTPSLVFASAGGDGGGSMVWKIINFVILAAGVYLVWTRVINGLLDKRSVDIKKALDEARRAGDEAEKKAAEYREKLRLLDSRVAEIQNELRLEGEAEKERMILEAGKAAERLKEQAKTAAAQEVKKARLEIRAEATRVAVELAGEILKKEISPADQERLVKGYLDNLRLN